MRTGDGPGPGGRVQAVIRGLGAGIEGWIRPLKIRTGDGPGHGGRVEAVVDEPLGDIDDLDVCRLLELAQVQDELVRAGAVLAPAGAQLVSRNYMTEQTG
jgi:hypothetical protein